MNTLITWKNGNATVKLFKDGTREVEWPGDRSELRLDWPLNIDIRFTTKCAFGKRPDNGMAVCSFCHESARTDGVECNFDALKSVLHGLPAGVELAVGMNHYSDGLRDFLEFSNRSGWIVNVTVNQGLIRGFESKLMSLVEDRLVQGVGVSYRKFAPVVPEWLALYEGTVMHVIETIDTFDEVMKLRGTHGVKKILVLGEKDFGFNIGKVQLGSRERAKWYNALPQLFKVYDIVSFDNLGVERMKPQRFLSDKTFDEIYQGEHSFYINAVDQTFSPSSRSANTVPFCSIKEYFAALQVTHNEA